eukprot:COSAG06_NODE_23918_length_678_cov_0.796200_1_plen_35_part_10
MVAGAYTYLGNCAAPDHHRDATQHELFRVTHDFVV